jgi:hypothetical protein
MSTERIYLVMLVDLNGDETPLLAVRSEALAQEVASKWAQ